MLRNYTIDINDLQVKGHGDFTLNIGNFHVHSGETLAVVGANGSGKSTLIEAMLDFRERATGTVHLLGHRWPGSDLRFEIRANLGVQLQNISYPENFKVNELINLHRMIYASNTAPIFSAFDMQELSLLSYGKLSKGQKQRVDLFMAMAHLPKLLIIDEPSSGLDKHYQSVFLSLIQQRKNLALTTVMCSHTDLELELCDRVVCLRDGRVEQDFSGDFLQHNIAKIGTHKVILQKSSHWTPAAVPQIYQMPGIQLVLDEDADYALLFGDVAVSEAAMACLKEGVGTGMDVKKTTTNDVLRVLINKNIDINSINQARFTGV